MPTIDGNFEEHKPKLQLETAGRGPGGIVRTAVGAADGDGEPAIDSSWLPDAPWWWLIFVERKFSPKCRDTIAQLQLPVALAYLERAGIPPISRLALGLQWGFLDPQSESFGRKDLKELMMDAGLGVNPKSRQLINEFADSSLDRSEFANRPGFIEDIFEKELKSIEKRAVYHIWKYGRGTKEL